MTSGATEVHEATLGEHDHRVAIGEHIFVDLRLDNDSLNVAHLLEASHINFIVEMANIADDGLMLHLGHVLCGDDVEVASCSHINVNDVEYFFKTSDLIALHRRL